MSLQAICDKCKSQAPPEREKKGWRSFECGLLDEINDDTIDLCPACFGLFILWIKDNATQK